MISYDLLWKDKRRLRMSVACLRLAIYSVSIIVVVIIIISSSSSSSGTRVRATTTSVLTTSVTLPQDFVINCRLFDVAAIQRLIVCVVPINTSPLIAIGSEHPKAV